MQEKFLWVELASSTICHAKRAKSHDRLRLGVEAPEPVAPQRGRGRAREQARPDRVGGVEEREGLRVNAARGLSGKHNLALHRDRHDAETGSDRRVESR